MIGEPVHTCKRVDSSCRRCPTCKAVRLIPTRSTVVPTLQVCDHCDGDLARNVRRAS